MWHSPYKLFLYPDDPNYVCNSHQLTSLLEKLEFIDYEISDKRYAIGENFLSLLTFMGCSPNIELEPQNDKPYCYIEISTAKEASFIAGKNTKNALCENCKEPLSDPVKSKMICPNCNQSIDTTKLNWRKSAFIASCWICVGNIYELEAIPNDQLLLALENETGVKWKPAYIRQESL